MAVLVKVRTAAFKKLLQVGKNLEVVAGRVQLVGGTAWRRLWAWSGKMGNCGKPSLLQKAHRVSGLAVGEDGGLGQAQGCGLSFIREEVFGRMVSPLGLLVEGDCAVETVPTEMIGRLRLGFQAPMRLSRLKRQGTPLVPLILWCFRGCRVSLLLLLLVGKGLRKGTVVLFLAWGQRWLKHM